MTSPQWANVARATFVRDARMAASYRIGFVLSFGGAVLGILGLFFLSRTVGPGIVTPINQYGSDYFSFAVVGVALSTFMGVGLTGIGARIREGQVMGTLELMLLSPNRLGILLLSASLWGHFQAAITLTTYVLVAALLGMHLDNANLPMAALSLVLAAASFNALGLLAASVVIVIKQGNPVSLVIGTASVLLGGVLYPPSVLPEWLQTIGHFLPLNQALELLRRSLLNGEGIATLWGPFLTLIALTAIYLPIGLWACGRAIRLARSDGSLAQY